MSVFNDFGDFIPEITQVASMRTAINGILSDRSDPRLNLIDWRKMQLVIMTQLLPPIDIQDLGG